MTWLMRALDPDNNARILCPRFGARIRTSDILFDFARYTGIQGISPLPQLHAPRCPDEDTPTQGTPRHGGSGNERIPHLW